MQRPTRRSASLHIPDNPNVLRAIARVAVSHGHLEYMLKMTIRKLAGMTIIEVLNATKYNSMHNLRDRAKKLFRQKTDDEEDRLKFISLMQRAQELSDRRNALVHRPWGRTDEMEWVTKDDNHNWGQAPTAQELDELANDIYSLSREISASHEHGYVAKVIRRARQQRHKLRT